ncbi:MAG TPA: P83/100 family protein, partial [Spirochaetales bacterium]|nr:P83/100 family protein [Spirochaetales bacterium]
FDADILILGEGARVDHIRNLRRIIAGYLEKAYRYSPADANTLATFITVYNAVYRGDMAYFGLKYKPVVLKELDAANAGLALRWDQWPGHSRIVIPLGARAASGVIGSVATGPITDKATVQSLGAEAGPAQAIEQRQDMVDIKERGIEQDQAAIAAEKERIAKEEAALAEQRAKLEEKKEAQAAAQPGQAQQGSIAESQAAKDEEKAIAQQEAAIAQQEAALAQDKEALAQAEEQVAAKEEEIAADREAIAAEQKDVITAEVAAQKTPPKGVTLFQLVNPDLPLARIVEVDLDNGTILKKSDVNTIRSQSVTDGGSAWIAVAGQTTAVGGTVRLVRVDKTDLSKASYGADDVFPDTLIWKYGNWIYAVVKKGADWAIGRFNPETLKLEASSAPVSKWTFLTQTAQGLVAQDPKGGFLILEPTALTTTKGLAP